jgi:hypothetical protein
MVLMGDLDGDGVRDIAISDARQGDLRRGSVRILSTVTGELLVELLGEPGERLGAALEVVADLDEDGQPDLCVSTLPGAGDLETPARVHAISSKSGERLWSADSRAPGDRYGYDLAYSRSRERPLLAVSAPFSATKATLRATTPGYVDVLDLRDGSRVATFFAPFVKQGDITPSRIHTTAFGGSVEWTRPGWGRKDLELIVADQEDHWLGGSLRVYSIQSGATLRLQNGPAFTDWGRDLLALPDLDEDGVCEYAVSALNDEDGAMPTGRVHVLSGATGEALYDLVSPVRARVDRLAAEAKTLQPLQDDDE